MCGRGAVGAVSAKLEPLAINTEKYSSLYSLPLGLNWKLINRKCYAIYVQDLIRLLFMG